MARTLETSMGTFVKERGWWRLRLSKDFVLAQADNYLQGSTWLWWVRLKGDGPLNKLYKTQSTELEEALQEYQAWLANMVEAGAAAWKVSQFFSSPKPAPLEALTWHERLGVEGLHDT